MPVQLGPIRKRTHLIHARAVCDHSSTSIRVADLPNSANGYYSSFTYFASKVLFDILPLRVVPPILFGGIVYGLVGLVPTVAAFWKFVLVLVLFNLTTASVILLISVACESTSVANLCGTLVILFK